MMKHLVIGAVAVLGWGGLAWAEGKAKHQVHEKHAHEHKKNCGHKTEKHGDHEDYVHGDHHHRKHAGHVDECEGDGKHGDEKKS